MKKHICYFLIILFTLMSLPLRAVALNETPDVISPLETQIVNINNADIESLILLKGIGEKKAQAIIAYRELHGEFNSVDDLLNVKGIGEKMLKQNREKIKL
ncbi:ComEA family DNA-binding protein [Cognaticolwellia mytili]|uniref:ComEA family DNA-binding protein n=1 Tax=Cognaticolwellia mytili TaxID=1888913 RepID=UPI000A174E11|nr:ComEA family DNA-binding protein [Cognaticolwellia mytili]